MSQYGLDIVLQLSVRSRRQKVRCPSAFLYARYATENTVQVEVLRKFFERLSFSLYLVCELQGLCNNPVLQEDVDLAERRSCV
jgi:hypothetical protein